MPADPTPDAAGAPRSDGVGDVPEVGEDLQTLAGPVGEQVSARFPKVEGYRITARLGEGGMGVVWRAIQLSTKREVALKLMSAGIFSSPKARHRFEREVEIAAEFQHPHIACIYDSGTDRGSYYYAMELIDGLPLDRYCASNKLSQRSRLELMWSVCDAMQHAHERGVIHRDLKPSNILVDAAGAPHIVDFGLAKSALGGDSTVSLDGDVLGTPAYMSPEQAEGKTDTLDTRSDVYSLGVILYHLLTGQFPHDPRGSYLEVLQRIAHEEIVHPKELDRELQAILLKALSRERSGRYASAGELGRDIDNYLKGELVSARRPTLFYFMGKAVRRRKRPLEVALVVAVLLGLGGYFLAQSVRHQRVADLGGEFSRALDAGDWSTTALARMETMASDLDQRSGRSGEMTGRLNGSLATSIRTRLLQPSLEEAQLAGVREQIAWLRVRDAASAGAVDRMLQSRTRVWEDLFALRPPHAVQKLIPSATVRNDRLVISGASGEGMLFREDCIGNVKLEAICDVGGAANQETGLVLYGRGKEGYFFRVNRRGMQIWRNGVLLRESPAGWPGQNSMSMRLEARREGNRLWFAVRDLPPLEFEDPFPIARSRQSSFGVCGKGTLSIHSLIGMRQSRAVAPSPLEAGDELFNAGLAAEAKAEYEKQVTALKDEDLQAVIYKIAACDLRTGNRAEAERNLKRLMAEPGERWPRMAGVHLWWAYVQQRRYVDADAVVAALLQRGTSIGELSRQLAALVPQEERYCGRGFNLINDFSKYRLFTEELPEFLPGMERAADMIGILTDDQEAARLVRLELGKAYHRVGKMDWAVRCFEPLLDQFPMNHWAYVQVREEYGWAMRLGGRSAESLGTLQKSAYEDSIAKRLATEPQRLATLLEVARVHAALKQWQEAEACMDAYFSNVSRGQGSDRDWASACLLRGFLRLRRGDEPGAMDAWRAGVRRSSGNGLTLLVADGSTATVFGLMNWVTHAALGGLTDQWDESDCRTFLGAVTRGTSAGKGTAYASAFQVVAQTTPTFLASMWRSPTGRELARSLAFRDINAAEWQRQLLLTAGREVIRVEVLGRDLSPEEEEVFGSAVEAAYATMTKKNLSKPQLMALLAAWGDTPVVSKLMGWDSVAPSLEPQLRGPLAHLLGWWYVKLGKRDEAAKYFQTAVKDAPADSALSRLAKAALAEIEAAPVR